MSKETAVGIDLGTTYSCVAVFQHGKVEIIANDQGNRTTPSYVAFTETERLIGDAAKNQVALNPNNTVFGTLFFICIHSSLDPKIKTQTQWFLLCPDWWLLRFWSSDAKRLIGRRFDDSVVQSDMKHWPFSVISDNSRPKVQVQYKGEAKTFYPEEISSMVLVKMKDIAESFLGKVTHFNSVRPAWPKRLCYDFFGTTQKSE